jgi:hypothetical protein
MRQGKRMEAQRLFFWRGWSQRSLSDVNKEAWEYLPKDVTGTGTVVEASLMCPGKQGNQYNRSVVLKAVPG